ncbi:MAG: hypothetical protein JW787_10670 [Sedimentisphaerales bacterium]|nr:hypothetical protein [Sedimentisphaerales bacterium]
MVTNTLTDQIIKAGKSLIKELEESGIKVDSALWFNYQEEGSWKLMLSFSNIEEEGPKAAYKKVQKALSNVQEKNMIFLDDIVIVEPNTRLIQSLKRAFNKCKDITISNSVIDGQLISGAHIYTL